VALAASLDYEDTLECVAKLAVSDIADWCVVDLAEPDDGGQLRLRRIAVAHADPAKELFIHQLQERFPLLEAEASHTALRVLQSGQTWFDPEVSPTRLQAESRDERHRELMDALGFGAEMVIPLIAHGRSVGTITLVRGQQRSYDRDDLAVAEELARRCAMAIANAEAFTAAETARGHMQLAAERTRRLQEITGQLSQSLEPERVLASIARASAELLQAPIGAVFLFKDGNTDADFVLAAAHGIDQRRALDLQLPRHASLAGRAIDEGRTLVVDDVREEPGTALPALLTGQRAGSEIAAPIIAGSSRLGVVKAFSPTLRRFSEDDAALLTTMAAAAAAALSNARLYREAQDATRIRDEFLSAAAHDLKSPLTSIKGIAQLLHRQVTRRDVPGSERLQQGLERIDAGATRMGQQLDELLDLTRLQMGQQLELRRRPTDLLELVRRAAAGQQELTDRHTIQVDTVLDASIGTWDAVRLERVVENLLSNAIKYSPAGGSITVAVGRGETADEPWAELTVTDCGLGIPADDLPWIFDRFRRATNVARRISGSGIGLASARQIVEQHGGTIAAMSVEGAGSTFTVRLPLTLSEPEEDDRLPGHGTPPDSHVSSVGLDTRHPVYDVG
jgi:signal transduction histidine kinase